MDFWGKKVNVSEEAARRQVEIYSQFSSEKRMKITLEIANLGIKNTHDWIKSNNPSFSELEVRLEFVRLIYFETGRMKKEHWVHFKKGMEEDIRKDWKKRFRKMMKSNGWTYDDVAKYGRFKNGEVVKATISRGLPAFAKLAIVLFEKEHS